MYYAVFVVYAKNLHHPENKVLLVHCGQYVPFNYGSKYNDVLWERRCLQINCWFGDIANLEFSKPLEF